MGNKKKVDDRFKKFGTVSFTATSKINDFIDYLESGTVKSTRCPTCGISFFPPRSDCHQCLNSDMEWFEIANTGTLVTYSRLAFAPVGFQDDVPYTLALLDYGDFRIFGRLAADLPAEEVTIGMALKTVANRLPNGQMNYVFQKA